MWVFRDDKRTEAVLAFAGEWECKIACMHFLGIDGGGGYVRFYPLKGEQPEVAVKWH